MTSNVKLLPLPDKVEVDKHLPTGVRIYAYDADTLKDYASANVEHYTAPLRYALDNAARYIKTLRKVRDALAAEIEALRAEVRTLVRQNGEWQARVERLADELRTITELRERHHDNLHDAVTIAEDALRDHEQEVGNG